MRRGGGPQAAARPDVDPGDLVRGQLDLALDLLARPRSPERGADAARPGQPVDPDRVGLRGHVGQEEAREPGRAQRQDLDALRAPGARRQDEGALQAAATSASAWSTGNAFPSSITPRGPRSSKKVRLAKPASAAAARNAERPGRREAARPGAGRR